ncbi:uncharacterized protein LOC134292062 [Aedes albopictus]|uniref:DUF5641 domain-containing protein n=1 Tax=Aedes albopictus TaxID=7160 RepID=A0ABM1ZJH7_AEDAL
MSAAGRTQHSPSRSQAPPPKQQFTVVKTPPPPPPRTWEKNQPRDEINTPKTVFGASSVYPMRHMKSRGLILSSMQRIYSYVERFNPETTSTSELEIRLETLQSIYSKFNAVQDSIIAQAETEEEMQDVEEKAEQFESMLFTTKARIVDLLRRSEDSQSVPDAPSALPVFDGDVMQWLPFSDSFTAMIHGNRGLSEIQKFHYLKSSLRGPALEIVNMLETTSGNYNIAWDLLRNRYQNKRVLMEKYVRGLFNLPTLSKESGKDLRKLHTDLNKHVAVINQLGIPTQAWDKIIVILISQKLDPFTYKEWENDTNPTELPSLNNFNSFLERRCQTLEAREVNRLSQLSISTGMKPAIRATPRPMLAHPSTQVPCLLECPTPHPLFMCPKFTEKHPSERIDTLRILGLCFNCMRSNHMANVCQARCCQKCGAKHNTMLHIEHQDDTVALNSCGLPSVPATQILLATAVVLVADRQGDYIPCRAMLDSGSQTNFISSNLVRTLRLQSNGKRLAIRGIGGTSCTATQSVQGTIKSRFNDFTVQLEFVVIDEITGIIPARKYNPSDLDLPTGIAVADPSFYKPARIDVLLGAEVFHEILVGEPIVRRNQPALQNTQFGFVVSGKMNNSPPQRSGPLCHLQTQRETYDDANVEMLWNLEEHGSVASRNDEELECESHFVKNTVRNSDGRFMVQLPLKENPTVLGDSKCYAMSESMIAPAEPDYSNIPTNRLSMYQDIKQRQQVFWKRFSKEYLNTLQQRMKNRRLTPNLAKGQLVIIKEDNLPPLKWAMGRIVDLTPGNDGLVRVAEVRTTGGVIKRSISKICPLPTEQQLDNLKDE